MLDHEGFDMFACLFFSRGGHMAVSHHMAKRSSRPTLGEERTEGFDEIFSGRDLPDCDQCLRKLLASSPLCMGVVP